MSCTLSNSSILKCVKRVGWVTRERGQYNEIPRAIYNYINWKAVLRSIERNII